MLIKTDEKRSAVTEQDDDRSVSSSVTIFHTHKERWFIHKGRVGS